MAVASACPDVSLLQQLALGNMSPAEVENLARHCEQCPRCIQLLHSLKAEDTLIEAMAAQGTAPDQSRDAVVNALIERLKHLPSPASSEEEMTATAALGPTPSIDAPPAAAIENTLVGDVSLAPAQSPDEIGRLGGYRVLKILGAGGMGMVYHAEDVHLQRPIALKVMKPEVSKNATARERFLREARAAAKLKSDHVVNIYQVGEERQTVFLAMEFLEGMSLEDWLKKGRKPTLAQTARIGRQIALGLADAHACGLIHRDIKPGNIWLDSRHQGRVKLLDFGLARGDSEEHQLTQSGAIVGTPAYMAPEQARGEHVDPRGDLFSLGVVLYRLTTGQLPFRGDNTMSILTSLALDTPKPPREIDADIPPRLASLIERLLSKDREQRPKTAKAVADELAAIEREATEERTMRIRAATVRERPAQTAPLRSRLRWLAAASLLLLLAGAAAAIVVIIRDKQGNKIAEIDVAPDHKVEIHDDSKGKDEAKAPPAAPKEAAPIAAALAPLRPGEPLSRAALVRRPAKLPGVRSWSIEKRDSWMTTVVAYRPDGKRLAVGDSDGSIRIWEPQSGRLVQMAFETRPVGFLAWSPDGKTLAVGVGENPAQNAIQLWDAQAGRSLWRVETPPGGGLSALAWSADGRALLATVTNVGCLTWNPADGKLLRRVAILCGFAAFSPDAKRLAGETGENRRALWDVETGKEIRKLEEHKHAAMSSLAWSPDGKRLALTATDGVYVWQAETGERLGHYRDLSQGNFVCWSPNGRTFAVSLLHPQGTAVVDVGAEVQPRKLEDVDGLASLAWSPDGKTIARIAWGGGGGGGWVRLYDAATGKRQRSLTEGSERFPVAALSANGQTIAVAEQSEITLSSMDAGQVLWRLKETSGVFALSPDGKRLATGGPDHAVILWEDGGKVRVPLLGHQQDVTWLAWSSDGKRLASASAGEKRLLLWDADKGERLRELGPFPAAAQSPTWSPDGRFVAFNGSQAGWHVCDVDKNKLANDPKQWLMDSFLFAPDGKSVLARSNFHDIYRLRDWASGKELGQLPYVRLPSPAWSPDGRLLAVAVNGGVELWRGDLRRRLRTLKATSGIVEHYVAFSPDGKLVAGRAGERLHVWETHTGRLRGILLLGEKNNGLTITPEGHYTGNEQVEHGIVVVVQKDDGTQELLESADFEQKYGWKNHPDNVHLLNPLPPLLYPLPGQPMGPNALVREPAELPDANSWTIETVNPRGSVKAVAYRPDGKQLASGGEDGTIRIWDTSSGKLVRMLVGDPVESLWWSKDGKMLSVAASRQDEALHWDADAGRLLERVPEAARPAKTTENSPGGKQTAKADPSGVCLFDAATGKRTHVLEQARDHPSIWSRNWSPDSRRLAIGFLDTTVPPLIVEAATGQRHAAPQDARLMTMWSPDGKTLAASTNTAIGLWDADTNRLLRTLESKAGMFAWSPNGKMLAGFQGPRMEVWSMETGQQLWRRDEKQRRFDFVWSPDSRQLAITTLDGEKGTLWLREADTGKPLLEVPCPASGLSWSPDGKTLAAGPVGGGECVLLDVATGKVRVKAQGAFAHMQCIRWAPDGKTFCTLDSYTKLRFWDGGDGRQLRSLHVGGPNRDGCWSPDSRVLARSSMCQISLYNADSQPLGALLPFDAFGRLAVTADGRYRGNARVERLIRMVVQKSDGTSETLTPREFEQKYNFKNDPAQVRLIDK